MPNESASVLAEKIRPAKVGSGSVPDLADFASAIAKAIGAVGSELLQAECEASAETTVATLKEILANRPDPGVSYWLIDSKGAPIILASTAPSFAAAVATRLLGGDFAVPSGDVETTLIDFDMAGSLVDCLTPALNKLFQRTSQMSNNLIAQKRGARTTKEAIGEHAAMNMLEVSFELQVNGESIPKAISLAFQEALIERSDFAPKKSNHPASADAAWAEALKRNVLNTELPLAVVLDRLSTSVGDLSRLKVGQIIDINPNALSRLDISAATNAGPTSIARGKLGAHQTRKAVKLTTGIDRDFLRGL